MVGGASGLEKFDEELGEGEIGLNGGCCSSSRGGDNEDDLSAEAPAMASV
jgi:hypothetical protein